MPLSETLYRVPRSYGLHPIQRRGQGAARELSSWRLRLAPGDRATFRRAGEEAVVVLQEGRGIFKAGGSAGVASFEVARRSVFAEPATALYLPPGSALEVTAATDGDNDGDGALEAIIVATPVAGDAQGAERPVLIDPGLVRVVQRGHGGYAREVHDILVRNPSPRRLLVGETFNPPGHWSSFPPHKHDGKDGEPALEEVYHYRFDPPGGFAQQLLYTTGGGQEDGDGESVAHTVRDGDAVLLPYGYHPVAAPPGYRLYYLWALAGSERRLALHEDPAHSWIHDLP